jgi:uncharacterized membrane protein (DUF4010 family)
MGNFLREIVNSQVWYLYEPFVISLVLGGLVGVEREFKKQKENRPFFGGIRTFILISLLGTLSGELSASFGLPIVYVSAVSLSFLIVGALLLEKTPGLTSEISALITFYVGLLCSKREYEIASLISISLLFVLSFKEQMHKFVKHLTLQDLYAFLKFAAVTVIIYPLLPNKSFYGVNPKEVWTMVVVISGIDFLGYVLTKVAGERGIVITGLIGGLVSSTAVTASFSPLSKVNPSILREYAAGIVGASSIMFLRMTVLAAVVNLRFAERLFVPSFIAFLFGIVFSYWLSVKKTSRQANVNVTNPFELSTALKFGAFYALILFLSKNAVKYFGNYGLYVVAAFSGLSDVDAITLSTAKLFSSNVVSLVPGIFTVLLAAFVNTVFKWFLTLSMGTRELFKLTTPGFLSLALGEILGFLFFIF